MPKYTPELLPDSNSYRCFSFGRIHDSCFACFGRYQRRKILRGNTSLGAWNAAGCLTRHFWGLRVNEMSKLHSRCIWDLWLTTILEASNWEGETTLARNNTAPLFYINAAHCPGARLRIRYVQTRLARKLKSYVALLVWLWVYSRFTLNMNFKRPLIPYSENCTPKSI